MNIMWKLFKDNKKLLRQRGIVSIENITKKITKIEFIKTFIGQNLCCTEEIINEMKNEKSNSKYILKDTCPDSKHEIETPWFILLELWKKLKKVFVGCQAYL